MSYREIRSHHVSGKAHCNKVFAHPGDNAGGAPTTYVVIFSDYDHTPQPSCLLKFQDGPIDADHAPNGIHHEDLLAVVADRLERFQKGAFACEENARALAHVQTAQEHLKSRTRARIERAVEGTHEP